MAEKVNEEMPKTWEMFHLTVIKNENKKMT